MLVLLIYVYCTGPYPERAFKAHGFKRVWPRLDWRLRVPLVGAPSLAEYTIRTVRYSPDVPIRALAQRHHRLLRDLTPHLLLSY